MKADALAISFLLAAGYSNPGLAQGQKNGISALPVMDKTIKVLELRNYLMRPGKRDEFINYFEDILIQPQEILGVNILGQFRVKGSPDNFFWMRGFKDMGCRSKFLNDFYYGSFWKQHKSIPNSLLLNNDNVYLLTPLNMEDSLSAEDGDINAQWYEKDRGIAVVDFFISNTKLDKLITFVKDKYLSLGREAGIDNSSFWVSEPSVNDFPALPVFQDKNLLVQISFHKNEAAYKTAIELIDSKMTEVLKSDLADLVTVKNTVIIYPTMRSLRRL